MEVNDITETLRALHCSLETDGRFSKKERQIIKTFLSLRLPENHGFLYEVESPTKVRSFIETKKPLSVGDVIDMANHKKTMGIIPRTEIVEWKIIKPLTSVEATFLK